MSQLVSGPTVNNELLGPKFDESGTFLPRGCKTDSRGRMPVRIVYLFAERILRSNIGSLEFSEA